MADSQRQVLAFGAAIGLIFGVGSAAAVIWIIGRDISRLLERLICLQNSVDCLTKRLDSQQTDGAFVCVTAGQTAPSCDKGDADLQRSGSDTDCSEVSCSQSVCSCCSGMSTDDYYSSSSFYDQYDTFYLPYDPYYDGYYGRRLRPREVRYVRVYPRCRCGQRSPVGSQSAAVAPPKQPQQSLASSPASTSQRLSAPQTTAEPSPAPAQAPAPATQEGGAGEGASGSDIDSFYKKIDSLIIADPDDHKEAFALLTKKRQENPALDQDANFLWRLGVVTYYVAYIEGEQGNKDKEKEMTYTFKTLLDAAMKLDEKNAMVHRWYAQALGAVAVYESVMVQVQSGMLFKEHMLKAIEIDPKEATFHNLLGRWCYEVAMLSWMKKKAAAAVMNPPPSSTIDEALQYYLKAEELSPGTNKENLLYIGKCYIEKKNKPEAKTWLTKAKDVPTRTQAVSKVRASLEEQKTQKEVETLLSSL